MTQNYVFIIAKFQLVSLVCEKGICSVKKQDDYGRKGVKIVGRGKTFYFWTEKQVVVILPSHLP